MENKPIYYPESGTIVYEIPECGIIRAKRHSGSYFEAEIDGFEIDDFDTAKYGKMGKGYGRILLTGIEECITSQCGLHDLYVRPRTKDSTVVSQSELYDIYEALGFDVADIPPCERAVVSSKILVHKRLEGGND